ncbi:MAG: UvrD-helicase domain-containing protein [Clostridia bacterium]|nr:UvrD-helicase domain-containing protein [Clostridia bacterium]
MPRFTNEQLEVVTHGKGNILVSASAGSGKTHTMIERVKRLIIKDGVEINRVLAVTFTEAAAADMKEKLKSALMDAVVGNVDSDLYGAISEEQKSACERQLSEIATADICTMHAFCGRLIRNYFFVVGVSPDFKILDETEAKVLRNQSIDRTFKEFYDANEEWFLTLVDCHSVGRMDSGLKDLVLSAYAFCDSEASPFNLYDKYKEVYSNEGFNRILTDYKTALNDLLYPIKDEVQSALNTFEKEGLVKGVEFTKTLLGDISAVILAPDLYAVKGLEDYKLKLDFERKLTAESQEQKERVAKARDKFKKLLKRFLKCVGKDVKEDLAKNAQCYEHTKNFVKILERFSQIYSEVKKDENALDFNDLEHFALRILYDQEIRDTLREKYQYIFVDEYQDTNGVQEEIISRIAKDNVFMVGDVKQSIYGFRGCRSEFFSEKDRVMTACGEKVVRLNHNFRSASAVINTINAVFNYCMTDKVYGENYKGRSELISGGIYPEEFSGRSTLHFLKKDRENEKKTEEPRIYDILKENPKEQESDVSSLSTLIASIIADERSKRFYDPKKRELRQVGYGDIAILTRSRKTELVKGLIKNGIPVSTDVNENVCDYPEIKVMINALKLTDCFLQDLPLVSTLKSAIGGFTEEELFEIVRTYDDANPNAHGSFSDAFEYYIKSVNSPLQARLNEFIAYFDEIRLISDFVGAHGVLIKIINDKAIEAHLLAQPLGVAKIERLKRFVSLSVSAGKTLTVKEFLNKIETCVEAFGLAPFAGEETVKVMTVHASKGLEFPVVILCGLEAPFNAEDERDEIILDREYGFAVKYYDDFTRVKSETLLRGFIKEKMRVDRLKEEMRLFYVAMTRATYSLHTVFMSKEDGRAEEFNGANSFLDFIPKWLPAEEHVQTALKLYYQATNARKVIIVKPDGKAVEEIKNNFSFVYPYLADSVLPLKGSVTALSKTDDKEHYTHVLFEEESPDAERGTIAHKILENFDFDGDDLYLQVNNMIEKCVLTREEVDKINLERLNKALIGGAFSGVKGKTLLRERAFLVNIEVDKILDTKSKEYVLLQGVIDLLIVDENEAEIIDYKYSSLSPESLAVKYKKQLDLYAYAVEKVLNKRVRKKTLINIFTGDTVELA